MAYDLYVVTDEELSQGLTHATIAELASLGGADVIQLRDKNHTGRELYTIAREIREVTTRASTLFIVNDRLDIALACGADGVHLGQDDLPLQAARKIAPSPFIIGISVGTVEEAIEAEKEGADYVGVGPVFSTGSKSDAGPGLGLLLLSEIRSVVSVPVIGIGGIHPGNAGDVITAGADGIAVISAVVSQLDVIHAAQELRQIIRQEKSRLSCGQRDIQKRAVKDNSDSNYS
ncbi:MAG: thiamine phosphate synthase [Methanobacteriota archaeon]